MMRRSVVVFLVLVAWQAALVASAPNAAYCSETGNDANASSPHYCSLDFPCRTPQVGIDTAETRGFTSVVFQAGTYDVTQPIVLKSNVSLLGGASADWTFGDRAIGAHQVRLRLTDAANPRAELMHATSVTGVTIQNMLLDAPDATELVNSIHGGHSIVIRAVDSDLTVDRCTFLQGNGRAGEPGTDGVDALYTVSARNGGVGSDFNDNGISACEQVYPTGGSAGAVAAGSNCDSGQGTCGAAGGAGGFGGAGDHHSSCPSTATDGGTGGTAVAPLNCPLGTINSKAGSAGGTGGGTCSNAHTYNNNAGRAGHSISGQGGTGASCGTTMCGSIASNTLEHAVATDGEQGCGARGGTGGGGGPGCDYLDDTSGPGGGAGGAGGDGAVSGGTAGGSGGSSIGVFCCGTCDLVVVKCEFVLGDGGAGGDGGDGGDGSPGGLGGAAGARDPDSGYGANGGNGADGGDSGGGGGGHGGMSVGVFECPGATVSVVGGADENASSAIDGGAFKEGSGGLGGTSSTNDGEDGDCGLPSGSGYTCGLYHDPLVCTGSSCGVGSASCTELDCPATATCSGAVCQCFTGGNVAAGGDQQCDDMYECTTPCENNGVCDILGACVCPPGFSGSTCEIEDCTIVCINGDCEGATCRCNEGFTGASCDDPVCDKCSSAHGTCVEPNKCECDEGWSGDACDQGSALTGLLTPERIGIGGGVIVFGAAAAIFMAKRGGNDAARKAAIREAARRPKESFSPASGNMGGGSARSYGATTVAMDPLFNDGVSTHTTASGASFDTTNSAATVDAIGSAVGNPYTPSQFGGSGGAAAAAAVAAGPGSSSRRGPRAGSRRRASKSPGGSKRRSRSRSSSRRSVSPAFRAMADEAENMDYKISPLG